MKSLVCNTSKSFLIHMMPPQRVGFLGLFGLELGIVFEETTCIVSIPNE